MATSSVTPQKAKSANSDSLRIGGKEREYSKPTGKPVHDAAPGKFAAGFLNPVCEHDWVKLGNDLQTLKPEGKTIWQCRTCSEITNTYDWQTPSEK
jgi:hypothetical protein